MNLTDKARRGSQEAMEALFDMTKNDVAYLCRLLLGDNQAASVAVPRARKMGTPQIERTSSPTIVTRPTLMPAPPSSYGPAPGTSPIPLK